MTRQCSVHALPVGIELLLVYDFTANEDNIGGHAGIALAGGGDSTVHEHAEIFVALPVFAGLDIGITVEPLDRLLEWREFGQHNSLDVFILIRIEHLEWSVPSEHFDILWVPCDPPVPLEPRSILYRLTDVNKIARHDVHLLQDAFCSLQSWETQALFRGLTLQQGESAD
jgi:hypothetical protein